MKLLLLFGLLVSSCSMSQSEVSAGVSPGERGFVDKFLQSYRPGSVRNGVPINLFWSNSLWGLGAGKTKEELFSYLTGWSNPQENGVHEAMQDFCVKNETRSQLSPLGGLSFKYVIQGGPDVSLGQGFDEEEYQKVMDLLNTVSTQPELIFISQPGFNSDGTVAVIYCAWHRGPLNAAGEIYVMELKEGKWVSLDIGKSSAWQA